MAPATDQELSLHQRLLAGDETASAEAFDRYIDAMTEYLFIRKRKIALHNGALIDEAVTEALFDYIAHPERYHPGKKCLKGYLCMAAEMDLLNRWRKVPEIEKAGKLISYDEIEEFEPEHSQLSQIENLVLVPDLTTEIYEIWQILLVSLPDENVQKIMDFLDNFVELRSESGNSIIGGDYEALYQQINVDLLCNFWRKVQDLIPEERERQVTLLMLAGVRETVVYAKTLAITGIPIEEQAIEVKRVKDKLKKRLQRADWSSLTGEAWDVK